MPLLVSLTDSEVYAVAGVVAQASNGVKDGGGVLEEGGSAWLPIDQEPLLSDLHVEPIYGDVQPGGQFGCAEGAGFMVPSFAGRAPLDAGDMTDPLYGVGENLLVAIGGTMALGREDGGDLDVGYTLASEIENSVAHFCPSHESVDGVDLHLDLKLRHGATTPDNSHQGDIVLTAVEHDLVDQTP